MRAKAKTQAERREAKAYWRGWHGAKSIAEHVLSICGPCPVVGAGPERVLKSFFRGWEERTGRESLDASKLARTHEADVALFLRHHTFPLDSLPEQRIDSEAAKNKAAAAQFARKRAIDQETALKNEAEAESAKKKTANPKATAEDVEDSEWVDVTLDENGFSEKM